MGPGVPHGEHHPPEGMPMEGPPPGGMMPEGMPMEGPGPDGPGGPGGPPPGMPDLKEMRKYCFRLIKEVTGDLGWKYKLWIPATVVLSAAQLLPPQLLQYFTESTQNISEINGAEFLRLLVIFGVGISVVLWLTIFFSGILSEWLRLTISVGLKGDAVKGMGATRIDALDAALRGDWMTRMSGDLFSAEEFLTQSLPDQVRDVTMMVGSGILFYFYSGPVAFLLILVAAFLFWFNIFVQRKMAPILGEVREIEGGVFQAMLETFEGLRTIRSYGAEQFTNKRISSMLSRVFDAGMRIVKKMAGLMGLNEMTGQLLITGLLTLVAYRVKAGELTAAEVLIYPFYINIFLGAVKGLAASAYNWNRFFIEGGRLAALLYDDSKKEDDHDEIYKDLVGKLDQIESMKVEDIVIAYGDAPPVIDKFDFELKSGEIVAIMGPSGCGKSTFVESFSGLRRANAGEFTVNLKDGSSYKYPQAPNFLSAFVEQQPYLFVGTIRDNITLGMPNVDDDTVWDALRETGLFEIVKYRGGLDSILADRGRNMSVGQQYRLALCRALVCGRPYLFMDEPFAALDIESVDLVVDALKEERNNGTGIILITHLLPQNLEADRVIKMEPVFDDYAPGPPPGEGFGPPPGEGPPPEHR